MAPKTNFRAYGLDNSLQKLASLPVVAKRNPKTSDRGFILGTLWINTTNDRVWTLSSVSNNVASWVEISPIAGAVSSWSSTTSTNQNLIAGLGLIQGNAAQSFFTLPLTALFGSVIEVTSLAVGGAGWRILQNAGQSMHIDNSTTTVGVTGFLQGSNSFQSIRLVCVAADTTWTVLSHVGTITIM